MPVKPIHETMMADLNYQIAEADKNASMHASKAATLRHLKDLYERRIGDWETQTLNEFARTESQSDASAERADHATARSVSQPQTLRSKDSI